MDIIEHEEPKGLSVPCRALTEEMMNTQIAHLTHTLEVMLAVKDNKENEKKIRWLFDEIKRSAWGLSVSQIIEGFKLYVDGKLSYNGSLLEPMSGYLDTILFKKVVQAYKEHKEPQIDTKQVTLDIYHRWTQTKDVDPKNGPMVFDYLYDNGLLPKRGSDAKVDRVYEKRMTGAKGLLMAPIFDKCAWMEREDLADTPKYREMKQELQKIKNGDHPDINKVFKTNVVKGFFEKLQRPLTDMI